MGYFSDGINGCLACMDYEQLKLRLLAKNRTISSILKKSRLGHLFLIRFADLEAKPRAHQLAGYSVARPILVMSSWRRVSMTLTMI